MQLLQCLLLASVALGASAFFRRNPNAVQLSPSELGDVMYGRACLSHGVLRQLDDEWSSQDASLVYQCLLDQESGRAQIVLAGCRLPSGEPLPVGGVLSVRGGVFRCNGRVEVLERLSQRPGSAALCRSVPETRAEMEERNEAVREANAAFLARSTTAADRAAYAALFKDSKWDTYAEAESNAYFQALLRTQRLDWAPQAVCYELRCRRNTCHGVRGQLAFAERCQAGGCDHVFHRLLDTLDHSPLRKTI